ncbi:hypothetical protein HK57_00484 [Aspergillus ustus]|uniref:DUF7924 domain-containing protein n=1 Tax=Aspergillus ustus TaxID=40382 RepID=A0A0C1EGH0_ASPUT|nr:hypothetical protein HK57_00484 [Aspergillus ustus]
MADHEQGIVEEAAKLCDELLEKDFEAPQGTLFNNQFLAPTLGFLKTKNKHAVIRLIGALIVPSVTAAALLGRISFKHIWTTTDDIWDYSIPLDESSRASTPTHLVLQSIQSAPSPKDPRSPQTPEYPQPTEKQQLFHLPRPQPTYAVGIVGREKEIHRQVLGFSISHTVQTVAIYAHYPFINADSKSVTFHFHEVTRYFLNGARGRDRWTSYKFALARYEHFAPELLKKLHSAIDDIPDDLDFEPGKSKKPARSPSEFDSGSESGDSTNSAGGEDQTSSSSSPSPRPPAKRKKMARRKPARKGQAAKA